MALIVCEGFDKVGKTTVAEHFKSLGYEYVHMIAPRKGITKAEYITEILRAIADTTNKNVFWDRSHVGELIWPQIYNREPLLDNTDIILFNLLCERIHDGDVSYIYMYDDNKEAHQERLRKFKEPSYDYDKVYYLYKEVMEDYSFEFITFQDAQKRGWITGETK